MSAEGVGLSDEDIERVSDGIRELLQVVRFLKMVSCPRADDAPAFVRVGCIEVRTEASQRGRRSDQPPARCTDCVSMPSSRPPHFRTCRRLASDEALGGLRPRPSADRLWQRRPRACDQSTHVRSGTKRETWSTSSLMADMAEAIVPDRGSHSPQEATGPARITAICTTASPCVCGAPVWTPARLAGRGRLRLAGPIPPTSRRHLRDRCDSCVSTSSSAAARR